MKISRILIYCIAIIFACPLFSKTDPVITRHSLKLKNGESIFYTAESGYYQQKEEDGKLKAEIFYIAYFRENVQDKRKRPITYCFNGGPGSSSVWLHMGGLGPKRIIMQEDGYPTPPPYEIKDNEYSWLEWTDLVFIDPVMTGYSRPAEGIDKKEFTGYEEDIKSVGEFIYQFTGIQKRWSSPKYLAGESYGTTRAAGLSGYLQDRYGLYLNGLVLVSAITNFQTARFEKGNDLPYPLFLPTYAATAWYHKKLNTKFANLEQLLEEVESFALNEYNTALMKGDRLPPDEKNYIVKKLAEYTGLSERYILQTNLRINIYRFVKELMRDEGIIVGRLDSRITASDYDDAGERYEFDPSYNLAIYGPYTMAIHEHLQTFLNVSKGIPYEILTGRVQPWNYSNVQNQYLNVSETLRSAMIKNPYLKVIILNGYYDLATPYFATQYTIDHMFLPAERKKDIQMFYYPAGHMMYIQLKSLVKMTDDVREFYKN